MDASRAIALAGSAGAIGALKTVLGGLPSELAAPVLVTVHVGAGSLNLLAQIFDAATPLAVTTARDGEPAISGHVYVAPADRHLLVIDRVIRLGRGPRENMSRPAIDPLFRALGLSYGSGAIGGLLSGYLNDGAAGIADLKRCGGLTVVQNPGDAPAPDMPFAALRASDVDYRAPTAEIAQLLVRLLSIKPALRKDPPVDVALEVDIALGRPLDGKMLQQIAEPSVISCPACGGVLSQVRRTLPLRYRCPVGHAFTGEFLAEEQYVGVDEAVRVALRIIEERAALTEKLAEEAHRAGRPKSAKDYERRAQEFRGYAEVLRQATAQA